MVCPRQVAWQLLFLAALVLNIVLLVYSFVSPRVSSSCVPNTNTGRSHTPQHDMKVEATQQYKPNRKASRETSSVLHYATRDCNKELEEGSLAQYLCRVEASVSFYSPPYPKPLVIAKDVTYSRYFAQRDLQAWTLAFNNISFSVSEVHRKTIHLADLTVFICLGIVTQDKHCLRPSSYHYLRQGQKFNQIHGVRESLWRKDGMCFMLREALATYDGPHDFTFPCWVLPTDIPDLRVRTYIHIHTCTPSHPLHPSHTHTHTHTQTAHVHTHTHTHTHLTHFLPPYLITNMHIYTLICIEQYT